MQRNGTATTRRSVFAEDHFFRRSSLRICQKRSADEYWIAHNFSGRLLDMLPSRRARVTLRKIVDFAPSKDKGDADRLCEGNGDVSESLRSRRAPSRGEQDDMRSEKSGEGTERDLMKCFHSTVSKKTMVLHVPKVPVLADKTAYELDSSSTSSPDEGGKEVIGLEETYVGEAVTDSMGEQSKVEIDQDEQCEENRASGGLGSSAGSHSKGDELNKTMCGQSTASAPDLQSRGSRSRTRRAVEQMYKQVDEQSTETEASSCGEARVSSPGRDVSTSPPCLGDARTDECAMSDGDREHSSSNYVQILREQLRRLKADSSDQEGNSTDNSQSETSCPSVWPSVKSLTDNKETLNTGTDKKDKETTSSSQLPKYKKWRPSIAVTSTGFTRRKASLAAQTRSSIMTWLENASHSSILGNQKRSSVSSRSSVVSKQPHGTSSERTRKRKLHGEGREGRGQSSSCDEDSDEKPRAKRVAVCEAVSPLTNDSGMSQRTRRYAIRSSRNKTVSSNTNNTGITILRTRVHMLFYCH